MNVFTTRYGSPDSPTGFFRAIKIFFLIIAIIGFSIQRINAQAVNSPGTAIINIDPQRTTGEIDPRIYGVFKEPIHLNEARQGLPDWTDTVSFLPK